MNVETIANHALKLNSNARAYLAQILLDSLDSEDEMTISSEWQQKIKKRSLEIQNNPEILLDGNAFLAELKEQYL